MSVKLLTEQHLVFLSLKGGCTSSYEPKLVKMPHVGNHMSRLICFFSFLLEIVTYQKNHKGLYLN